MPNEAQRQRVVIRRLKTDPEMVDATGKPLYPRRRLEALCVDYTTEEKEIHQLLKAYTESRKGMGGQGGAFIHKLLKKRLFSSPRAFHATLVKHRQALGRRGKDRIADPMELGILRRAILAAEEDYADDREVEAAQDEAVETVSERAAPLTAEQRTMVDRMLTWASGAANGADAKAKAIIAWLNATIRPGGAWSSERVILFTEYRATHAWLHQILVAQGYGEDRVLLLDGGTDPEDREKIKAAFQAPPDRSPARILLATDAASEGIDLQNFCRYMIHVEIPWNPNVLEQRNGRIDRQRLEDTDCDALGLTVVTEEYDELVKAAGMKGPLSFQDHLMLILAKGRGWTAITNDGGLRKALEREQVPRRWGLEMMLELVGAGCLASERAVGLAERIVEENPRYAAAVLAEFKKKVIALKPPQLRAPPRKAKRRL